MLFSVSQTRVFSLWNIHRAVMIALQATRWITVGRVRVHGEFSLQASRCTAACTTRSWQHHDWTTCAASEQLSLSHGSSPHRTPPGSRQLHPLDCSSHRRAVARGLQMRQEEDQFYVRRTNTVEQERRLNKHEAGLQMSMSKQSARTQEGVPAGIWKEWSQRGCDQGRGSIKVSYMCNMLFVDSVEFKM